MKKWWIVLLACGLASCIDFNQARVTPEHRQFKNNVAVVSFLSPKPSLHHLQLSVKESTMTTGFLPGWDANQIAAEFMAKRMRAMSLTVKSVPVDRAKLPNPYDSSMAYPNLERMRPALAAWGKENGLDMVITIYRQVDKDFIGTSIENMIGYGLVRHNTERTDAYARIYLEAVDVESGKKIGNAEGIHSQQVDDALWHDEYNVDKTPVPIAASDVKTLNKLLTQTLTDALTTAGQEAGLSN
jgi:hypothetical protein